ncbi:hypothetical protein [Streptomyces sp. NPDC005476]
MRAKLPANTPQGHQASRSFAQSASNKATPVRAIDHAFDAALPFE